MADMELYNALFYVDDKYGYRFATATTLDHGTSIIPQTEGATRKYSVWFSKVVTSSSFSVQLTWAKQSERDNFLDWMEQYALSASDTNVSTVPMMRIYIRLPDGMPDFTRIAFPTSGMSYSYIAGTVTHALTFNFVGTSDPIFRSLKTRAPGDPILEELYPGGYDLENAASSPSLYDLPSESEVQRRLNNSELTRQWFSAKRIAGSR